MESREGRSDEHKPFSLADMRAPRRVCEAAIRLGPLTKYQRPEAV
jgi:hypothetical protein